MVRESDRGARESSLASGWIVEAADTGDVGDVSAASAGSPAAQADPPPPGDGESVTGAPTAEGRQLSGGALVMLGVLGGLYLVYTWIWFSWAKFYVDLVGPGLEISLGALGSVLQLTLYWAAPLAPALWFIAVLLLNRDAKAWRLALWLLVGAVLLAPLPYLMWGA